MSRYCVVSFFTAYICTRISTRAYCSQDAIFRVVAAILHLGNIEFSKGKEIDSSEPKDDKSRFHLKTAAELFMYVIIVYDFLEKLKGKSSICKFCLGVTRSLLKTRYVNVCL